jgi:hypothetical protein
MAKRDLDRKKLRRAKNAVRGAFNRPKSPYFESINRWGRSKLSPADLIVGGFSNLNTDDAAQFLEWVKGFPSKAVQIFPTRPVEKPADLAMAPVKIRMPLLSRLNWLSALFFNVADDLLLFIALKTDFELRFIAGDYERSQSSLDQIKEKFGLSVWFIENQIALLQRWKGLDAQKEFSKTISATGRGKLAGVTSYWVSQRNEDNTIFSRFKSRLERGIEQWKVDESVRDAYAILLGVRTFDELPDSKASSALGSLASSSLVDAYTSFILAFETMFMSPQWPQASGVLAAIAARLPATDTRVRNIVALLERRIDSLPALGTEIVDSIAADTAVPNLANLPSEIAAFVDVAYVKSRISDEISLPWNPGTPAHDIYDLVDAAIIRPVGFDSKIDQGAKLVANLRHLNISAALHGFLVSQNPECPMAVPSPAILFFINSAKIHPWHSMALPGTVYAETLRTKFSESTFAKDFVSAVEGTLDASGSWCVPLREVAAKKQLTLDAPETALGYLNVNLLDAEDLERQRLAPLLTVALLRSGSFEKAIAACASACAIDIDLASMMPLRGLVDEAKPGRGQLTDHLSLAVLLNIYLEHFPDDDVFQLMQFAYEDFISSRGVERPSELIGKHAVGETARLIYFLRNVAVPEVMDVSFWLFKSSRDTQTERIAVCSALIELDPFYEDDYRDEIKERTKLLSIQDGLEDVDRSRVYVNLPKLGRWAEAELREGFERYQALLKAGVTADDPGEFDKALKEFSSGRGTLDRFADYPADESGQLLLDMFNSIAEKYLHDSDIGLDSYLSMRIRHGSLAGHIRGPLEEQGLLAVRDQGTNQYRMLRRPSVADGINRAEWEQARSCVETFSREFDAIIDRLAKEQLQIMGLAKPKGLFAFDPAPLIIYFIRAHVDKGSTLPEFLAKVFDALGVYLTLSLQNVRKFITGDFSNEIERCIDRFRASLDQNVSSALRSELQELLGRVSPELQASIERVASWFAPDAENERRALRTMEQIVDIAVEATNNAHRGFEPEITTDIEDLGLQANETFIEYTDILFTILDNIYRHSGLDTRPKINISITSDGDIQLNESAPIKISVSNTIAPESKTAASERKLDRIRAQIESGDYRALSKLEGGTGFLKLKRIVALDPRQTLQFGYRSNDPEFFVDITMQMLFKAIDETTDAAGS